jgi:hypothetical protein
VRSGKEEGSGRSSKIDKPIMIESLKHWLSCAL